MRVCNLAYDDHGKPHSIMPGLAGYVLPGESHSWTFPFHGPSLDITAECEQGKLHQSVALTAP